MMLVLSRRVGDEVMIPELGITVQVVSVKGKTVRLGIDAPPEINIMRGELLDSEKEPVDGNWKATVREPKASYHCCREGKKSAEMQTASRRMAV